MRKWRIAIMTIVLLSAALGIARAVTSPYIEMPEGTYFGPRQEALNADPSKGFGDGLIGIALFIGKKQELTIYRDKEKVHPAEAYLGRRCRPKGGCAVGFSEA